MIISLWRTHFGLVSVVHPQCGSRFCSGHTTRFMYKFHLKAPLLNQPPRSRIYSDQQIEQSNSDTIGTLLTITYLNCTIFQRIPVTLQRNLTALHVYNLNSEWHSSKRKTNCFRINDFNKKFSTYFHGNHCKLYKQNHKLQTHHVSIIGHCYLKQQPACMLLFRADNVTKSKVIQVFPVIFVISRPNVTLLFKQK